MFSRYLRGWLESKYIIFRYICKIVRQYGFVRMVLLFANEWITNSRSADAGSFNFDEFMVIFPNAKINIGLFVTEKRSDGFHNLETVFYPIDLRDILEITEVKGEQGRCVFTSTGILIDCPPEKNLVSKAYAILAAEYDLPSVDVHLHKIIP